MAERESNPDHKQRSDGGLLGGKAAQRAAKRYKATGEVTSQHNMTVGNGARELGTRRWLRGLFGDDD